MRNDCSSKTMQSKKPVLLLACGGTMLMRKLPNGSVGFDNAASSSDSLAGLIKDLNLACLVTAHHLFGLDSTDIQPTHWEEIGNKISASWPAYRGVVILTGTNTLAYMSSALSFGLHRISIPVLITGSQLPACDPFSDARSNLLNCFRVIDAIRAGVYVVFGNRVIIGCRAKKASEFALNAFETFNGHDAGEIGVELRLRSDARALPEPPTDPYFEPKVKFESRIACLTVLPGIAPELVGGLIKQDCKGLILRSFGSGDIPQSLFPALELARKKRVPVVNTTQVRGATDMGLNDIGRRALEFGVIQALDMSIEAMSTKLMWLLAQQIPYEEMRLHMHENIVGEISTEGR